MRKILGLGISVLLLSFLLFGCVTHEEGIMPVTPVVKPAAPAPVTPPVNLVVPTPVAAPVQPVAVKPAEPIEAEAEIAEERQFAGVDPWAVNATMYEGKVGKVFTLTLPPGGTPNTVWGTYIYTNDSSIGSAAVHSKLIDFATGGKVYFKILDGQTYYTGSTQAGVTSNPYGSWPFSYMFTDKTGKLLFPSALNANMISWNTTVDFLDLQVGDQFTVMLPPGGTPNVIWGTGTYSYDSSIGTAAVHSGLITFEDGGTVTVKQLDIQDKFIGTTQHGVTSLSYDSEIEAYIFL